MAARRIVIKRIYDDASDADGARILIDRLWPRGVRKADAHFDEWFKEIAPSTELRKWYGHDPDKFAEFAKRYSAELKTDERADLLAQLGEIAKKQRLTLLTATKDVDISAATVLLKALTTSK